jgi:hypothetical protein
MARKSQVIKAVARKMAKSGWTDFQEEARRDWWRVAAPPDAKRVYRNSRFVVIVYGAVAGPNGEYERSMIVPNNKGREVFWRDLQRIKNEVFGPEALGLQYFPRESELVDEANVYWLYVRGPAAATALASSEPLPALKEAPTA